MATNFIQSGEVVTVVTPAGGVSAGDPVMIGVSLFGVATHDAIATAPLELALTGVWTLPTDNTITFNAGDRCYWEPGAGQIDKTLDAGAVAVAICLVTQVNQTTGTFKLMPPDLAGG